MPAATLVLTVEGEVKAQTAARIAYESPLLSKRTTLAKDEDALRTGFADGDQTETTLSSVHLRLRKRGFENPEVLIAGWKAKGWVIQES